MIDTGTRLRRSLWIAAVAVIVACAWLPQVQALADAQVDAGLKRALISFASARTLNGLISVLQGTELSVQPLGVGVTLTLGQVLDPVNDLIEQFSTLMLYASVAFGVQKVLLAVGGHWVVSALVTAVALAWAVLYAARRSPPWLARALLVLLMVRFAIPVVTLGSDLLYRQWLAPDYAAQQASVDAVSAAIGRALPADGHATPAAGAAPPAPKASPGAGPAPAAPLPPASTPAPAAGKGWLGRLIERVVPGPPDDAPAPPASAAPPAAAAEPGWLGRLGGRIGEAASLPDFEAIKRSAESLPERIVGLIVIFLLQTMVVPIVLLWALYRLAVALVRPRPAWARQPPG